MKVSRLCTLWIFLLVVISGLIKHRHALLIVTAIVIAILMMLLYIISVITAETYFSGLLVSCCLVFLAKIV